MIKYLFSK